MDTFLNVEIKLARLLSTEWYGSRYDLEFELIYGFNFCHIFILFHLIQFILIFSLILNNKLIKINPLITA